MRAWWGKYLYIDVERRSFKAVELSPDMLLKFLGGRGLAIKLLWDLNPPGVDPFSPDNHLVLATGPLTGYPLPSSGKMIVASKSPLTYGYGDGNIGTKAAVELRKSGYDAVVIRGISKKPLLIHISCKTVEFIDAEDLWGLDTETVEKKIAENYGKNVGILTIGIGGENLVKFAVVVSEHGGRSGGRPGMGAVMGSKKIKAIVFEGCNLPEPYNKVELARIGAEGYSEIKRSPGYEFYERQGTMQFIRVANENSFLPVYNFREGVFEYADSIDGYMLESMREKLIGCPLCNMPCRHIIKYATETSLGKTEPDYENVALLGANLGVWPLNRVARLNHLADLYGLDTISLGATIGYAIELSEKKLIDYKIEWGDCKTISQLITDIANRRGIGDLLANGVRYVSEKIGGEARDFAMHVKGLEISAYNSHALEGMALSYGVSPIGAHHKDVTFASLDIKLGRLTYSKEKVERIVYLQNIRGGMYESLVTCRFPFVYLSFNLDYYPRLLKAATGIDFTWDMIHEIGNRIYALIRSFWVREYIASGRGWSYELDIPPMRWFKEPLSKGPLKGYKLDLDKYLNMLKYYYQLRGWDENGVPTRETLRKLGLEYVISDLEKYYPLK